MVSLRIPAEIRGKAMTRLDALKNITTPKDMDIPGFGFRELRGRPRRWCVHIEGEFYLTFEWENGPVSMKLEAGK